MESILLTLRNLGVPRLVTMGVVAVLLIGFFVFIAGRVTTPQMALLYGGLDIQDSGEVAAELDTLGITYEVRGNGAQILVPGDDVQRARIALAREGLPTGGSLGYEIFDRSSTLGTTSFVQNINLVRALEGELARTIMSFEQIDAARVHLVLPRRELFSRDVQKPTASVVVKGRGASQLDRGQIQAIQHLVAAAVPGLSTSRISIIDDKGNLLARAKYDEEGAAVGKSEFDDFRTSLGARLRKSIERLLERSVGIGAVRAEVSADIDFDMITESSEIFDPDGQVVRSTQTIEDTGIEVDRTGQDPVTVGTNLPEAAATAEDGAGSSRSQNSRTEETVNFKISRTTTTTIRESGIIDRLTVAVLVDGTYAVGDNGERSYSPRSEAELTQLAALVRSAVGFDQGRGDTVEVINMRFAFVDIPEITEEISFFGLAKEDYFQIAEFLLIAVVVVLVILLVLRPLVARAVQVMAATAQAAAEANQMQLASAEAAAAASSGAAAIAGPRGDGAPSSPGVAAGVSLDEIESMIDISAVEGQVRASSVRKIGEIIDKHPEEALSILRTWLYQ